MSDRKSPHKTEEGKKTSFLEFASEFLAPNLNQLIEGEVKDELETEDLKTYPGLQVPKNETNQAEESKLHKETHEVVNSTASNHSFLVVENEKPQDGDRLCRTPPSPVVKRHSHKPAIDLGTPVVRSEIHRPSKTINKRYKQELSGEEATSSAPTITQQCHEENGYELALVHPLNETSEAVPVREQQELIHGSCFEECHVIKSRGYELPYRTKEQLHALFGAKAATNTQTIEQNVDQIDTQSGKEKENQRTPSRLHMMFSKSKKEKENEHDQSSRIEPKKETEIERCIKYTKDMGVYDQTKDFESRLREESQRNDAGVTYSINGHVTPTRVRFLLVKEAPRSRLGCNNKVAPVLVNEQSNVAGSKVNKYDKSCQLSTPPKNSKILISLPTPPKSCKGPKWFKRRKADSPKPVVLSKVDEQSAQSVSSQFNVQSPESQPLEQEPVEKRNSRPSRAGRRQKT